MFKRLSAIFVAFIMCLSLMTPAFAASTSDNETITIKNVEANSSLTAYQIIEPVIDSSGNFVGWKWSSSIENCTALLNMVTNSTTEVSVQVTSGENTETNTYKLIKDGGISLANVQAIIAQGVSVLGSPAIESKDFGYANGNYTATASVGSYLISVKPDPNAAELKIYQPMIVSVDYSGTNSAVKGGIADANAVLNIGDEEAYAKSSTVSIDKSVSDTITKENTDGTSEEETQRDYSVGDTINYVLTTTIPSYQLGYFDSTKLTFTFTDTMDKSLTYGNDLVIQKPVVVDTEEGSDEGSSEESTDTMEPAKIPAKEEDGTVNYELTTGTTTSGQTTITVEFTSALLRLIWVRSLSLSIRPH